MLCVVTLPPQSQDTEPPPPAVSANGESAEHHKNVWIIKKPDKGTVTAVAWTIAAIAITLAVFMVYRRFNIMCDALEEMVQEAEVYCYRFEQMLRYTGGIPFELRISQNRDILSADGV
jgi:hypothetical protein